MEGYRGLVGNMVGQGDPERIEGASVTADMFTVLGVQPSLGRNFTTQDDRDSAPGTVILSYGLWQAHFGGDSNILGHIVDFDNTPYTIIGVMPYDFFFPRRARQL